MKKINRITYLAIAWITFSCEPLVTTFDIVEDAILYEAKNFITAPAPETSVRVMTWNIRFGIGRLPFFGDSCGDRSIFTEGEVLNTLELIAAEIDAIDPDIILLQEVDRESKRTQYIDQVQWLLNHTDMNYAAYASMWKAQVIPSDGIGRIDVGNVVMSKWEIEEAERIQLSPRTDQDALTQMFYLRRNVLKTKIDIPEKDNFYAVNIHVTAFATDDTKQKHIDKFKEIIGEMNEAENTFVAGGDFNSVPPDVDSLDFCIEDMCDGESFHNPGDNPEHKEGSYFNNFVNEPSILKPLYDSYNSAIMEDTATDSAHYTHSISLDRDLDRKLDYIFFSQSLETASGTTHQDVIEDEHLSDHAPVSVTISLEQ